MTIIIGIQDSTTEQTAREVLILLIFKFRQQFLFCTILLIETLDGLQHKGIHDFLIIIPIQTLVLQNLIQFDIIKNNIYNK